MSFYTSLSGLKGAQSMLSVISNNVANVATTGFKRSTTEFGDIISSSATQSSAIAGQGTRLQAITQQFSQGGFETSERTLDLAVGGQGMFVTRSAITGGTTTFTRAGAFSLDSDRYVKDSSGAFLQVLPVDSKGEVTATSLDSMINLQLPLTSGKPKSTSLLSLGVTLPSEATVPANSSVYTTAKPYAFKTTDPNSYNESTTTTIYDSLGNPLQATVYFIRETLPGTDGVSKWDARLYVGDKEISADPTNPDPPKPLKLSFDSNGEITTPTAATQFAAIQPTGTSIPFSMSIDFGRLTKQASVPFTVTGVRQNGFASGQLDNVSVGADGLVSATFSNGASQALGKVALANFVNPAGLRQIGDSKWTATGTSGAATIGTANNGGFGKLQSGALERANVDITEELVALITAQRNFSANAKAIETANNMTQTIVQLRS
jgi:flagellar hook protein FlgE